MAQPAAAGPDAAYPPAHWVPSGFPGGQLHPADLSGWVRAEACLRGRLDRCVRASARSWPAASLLAVPAAPLAVALSWAELCPALPEGRPTQFPRAGIPPRQTPIRVCEVSSCSGCTNCPRSTRKRGCATALGSLALRPDQMRSMPCHLFRESNLPPNSLLSSRPPSTVAGSIPLRLIERAEVLQHVVVLEHLHVLDHPEILFFAHGHRTCG